jgi:hypothetical protein
MEEEFMQPKEKDVSEYDDAENYYNNTFKTNN